MMSETSGTPQAFRQRELEVFVRGLPDGTSVDDAIDAWVSNVEFMSKVYSADAPDQAEELRKLQEAIVGQSSSSEPDCIVCGAQSIKGRDVCKKCNYEAKTGKKWPSRPQPKTKASKSTTSKARKKGNQSLSGLKLRRARGEADCPRCGKRYRKGDRLVGTKGYWFHEHHLSDRERSALYSKRLAGQSREIPGGGSESNRRRH